MRFPCRDADCGSSSETVLYGCGQVGDYWINQCYAGHMFLVTVHGSAVLNNSTSAWLREAVHKQRGWPLLAAPSDTGREREHG